MTPFAPDAIKKRSRARVRDAGGERILILVPNLERVRIGSDGACDLVLAGLPPCAAVVFEHAGRLVLREQPARPKEIPRELAPGDRYIDDAPFEVGRYTIQLASPAALAEDDSANDHEVLLQAQHADGTRWSWKFRWREFRRSLVIGSDCGCHVVLPGLEPAAAVVFPGSNHRLLRVLPAATRLPIPQRGDGLGGFRRIDRGKFQLGDYTLQFVD